MSRLANEKTLELNITHELLLGAGIGALGFTQQEESRMGADVLFPCSTPMVLQYKAAKGGSDGSNGIFYVNNNQNKNQHIILDAIAQSGFCRAVYVFPLIISDPFLNSNFGNLLNYTCALDADMLTGNLNWNNTSHRVEIDSNYNFIVHSSEEFKGVGYHAKKIMGDLSESKFKVNKDIPMSKFIPELVGKLHKIAKRTETGYSEHTVWTVVTDKKTEKFGYFALPLRL